ncbi:hypothetical protein CGZ94_14970 [Enemella evansiae]|uniref:Alpha/beta hydrolase n=1 Tax=Enemella evansiae TaxID=2016499 RepID=A0A255G8D5_9ACTN|nr:hypothetical protein CGZ98_14815 [Enemella evansiae]OYO11712.1 hypothetical protein CGZ94_14970 [Enemella evansiae]
MLAAVALLAATVVLAPRATTRYAVEASASPAPAELATDGTGDGLPHSTAHPSSAAAADDLTRGLSRNVVLRSTMIAEKDFSYCSNGPVDDPPAEVRRVVFVVHGNDRRPCGMAGAVLAGATDAQREQTLVVAPRFASAEDTKDRAKELYWTFSGWSQGDPSVNPGAQISSYAVLDELIRRVGHRSVVVAGFSGGGQFVNRFAAGSASQPDRFVIANPSSYLYFTPARPGTPPEEVARCPGYNDYRYGLNQLNPYMAASGPKGLTERYGKRKVVYLLGDRDRDPRSSSMDKSCGANVEGPNRLERGQRYWAYLPSVYGPEIRTRQQLHLVPGVAHDAVGMFTAAPARQALLG